MLDEKLAEAVDDFALAYTREPNPEKRPGAIMSFKAGWEAACKLLGYGEKDHMLTVDPEGWRMQHTLDCRVAGIDKCVIANYIITYGPPPVEGDFRVVMDDDGSFSVLALDS